MVKLVDTLVSGTSGFTAVQVRVLFRAQLMYENACKISTYGHSFFKHTRLHTTFLSFIILFEDKRLS
jgi:hypothetical protein